MVGLEPWLPASCIILYSILDERENILGESKIYFLEIFFFHFFGLIPTAIRDLQDNVLWKKKHTNKRENN